MPSSCMRLVMMKHLITTPEHKRCQTRTTHLAIKNILVSTNAVLLITGCRQSIVNVLDVAVQQCLALPISNIAHPRIRFLETNHAPQC